MTSLLANGRPELRMGPGIVGVVWLYLGCVSGSLGGLGAAVGEYCLSECMSAAGGILGMRYSLVL